LHYFTWHELGKPGGSATVSQNQGFSSTICVGEDLRFPHAFAC
jgi:hypothetical protein